MDKPLSKKYLIDSQFKIQDMQMADQFDELIRKGKLTDFGLDNTVLFNLLVKFNKEESIRKLLEKCGIKPTFEALQQAIAHGQTELAMLIIEKEPNLLHESNHIGTPLHIATVCNNPSLAQKLLEMGIDVNGINMYHDTPLHVAAKLGLEAMVFLLCEHGANPFIKNQRKFGRGFDSLSVAYRHAWKLRSSQEPPYNMVSRHDLFIRIMRIMYKYVEQFGGKVGTNFP